MIKWLLSDFAQVILFPKDKNYSGTLNDLFAVLKKQSSFSFFDTYELNQLLLDLYQELQEKHSIHCGIFSNGTMHTDPELQPLLAPVFDHLFSVKDIHIDKTDPEAYRFLANTLGCLPTEIIFVDDTLANVQAANEAGVHGIQYISNEQITRDIRQALQ